MRRLYLLILIALALLLSGARNVNAPSAKPRPNQPKKSATEKAVAQPIQPQPTVPLRDFQASQSALFDALRTIQTQAETAAKQNRAQYEPWDAPSALIQIGLLLVGSGYTVFACLQWAAIRRQVAITRSIEAPFLSVIIEPHGFPPVRDRPMPMYVEYWFQNEGRTPALLQEVAAEIGLVTDLPDRPRYREKTLYPFGTVAVGPNGAKGQLGRSVYEIDWNRFIEPSSKWLFFGYVKYVDVLAKAETRFGFGFQLDPAKGGFIMIDHLPYNYRYYYEKRWYHRFYQKRYTDLSEPE